MPGDKYRCLKCGDVIQSMYTHDFKACKCGNIKVDGGASYGRYLWEGPGRWEDNAEKVE